MDDRWHWQVTQSLGLAGNLAWSVVCLGRASWDGSAVGDTVRGLCGTHVGQDRCRAREHRASSSSAHCHDCWLVLGPLWPTNQGEEGAFTDGLALCRKSSSAGVDTSELTGARWEGRKMWGGSGLVGGMREEEQEGVCVTWQCMWLSGWVGTACVQVPSAGTWAERLPWQDGSGVLDLTARSLTHQRPLSKPKLPATHTLNPNTAPAPSTKMVVLYTAAGSGHPVPMPWNQESCGHGGLFLVLVCFFCLLCLRCPLSELWSVLSTSCDFTPHPLPMIKQPLDFGVGPFMSHTSEKVPGCLWCNGSENGDVHRCQCTMSLCVDVEQWVPSIWISVGTVRIPCENGCHPPWCWAQAGTDGLHPGNSEGTACH